MCGQVLVTEADFGSDPRAKQREAMKAGNRGGGNGGNNRARALFAYLPVHAGDLQIAEGDEVTILSRGEDGWWTGSCKGKKGRFPGSYVQEEEAAPKALVDDANDLWRPASAVWFLACAAFMGLGARDACRGPSARGWLARHDRGAAAAVFVFAGAAAAAPALLVVRANAARRDDAPAFVSPLLASPARALVVAAGVVGCGVVAARISS